MQPVLEVKNLSVTFGHELRELTAVNNISFSIPVGKTFALIGESGSGKSITALSILRLLPETAVSTGNILFHERDGKIENMALLPPGKLREIRGNKIAMIFQEPMTSLNPVLTCGAQVAEALMLHRQCSKKTAREETLALFAGVELPTPAKMLKRYPHELSGGQKQRVMIAIAMSCSPLLLIADEPTTALDVRVQKSILQLLKKLQAETGMSVLLITHDLALVADIADEIAVMHRGEIAEQGSADTVCTKPVHSYTKALLAARPSFFSDRAQIGKVVSENFPPTEPASNEIVLAVNNVSVRFPTERNFLGRPTEFTEAVRQVSFNIFRNETVGLVGESGCGKTTLGRAILQLVKPISGSISLNGQDLAECSNSALVSVRKDMQVVFQDPYGSLNPRLSVGSAIHEPMKVHFPNRSVGEHRERIEDLLVQVGLPADFASRFPHQLSGGQRQRVCIARALSLEPNFMVFDESVSALDMTAQSQILHLIRDLKKKYSLAALFISHDLSVIAQVSDRVMVMARGSIIETGSAEEIFFSPREIYTKSLIAAVPRGMSFHGR